MQISSKIDFVKSNYANLREKVVESLRSILPVTAVVFMLCFFLLPLRTDTMALFIVGSIFLIFGMGLFTLGTDIGMMPIGNHIGTALTKSRRLWVILFISLIIGTIVTISEPDLHVLAEQIPNVSNSVIILSVAFGVGSFLVLSVFRIFIRIRLSVLLVVFYAATFILACFVPKNFLSVAFDAGGVTTGPITVPFVMALGIGFANIRSDKDANNDSFGLIALCSIGPILAVMVLSMIYKPEGAETTSADVIPTVADTMVLWKLFYNSFPKYMHEVGMAILPIIIFFVIFQIFVLRLGRAALLKIAVGLFYTYWGLVIFFVGVNVGFIPVGNLLGKMLGEIELRWLIIPIGMILGYFIVEAEPAVKVLTQQVNEITMGIVSRKALGFSLSLGVACSIGLAMYRIIADIPLMYLLIPGYLIAVGLIYFVPPVFTAIAFDSGGVASGPMTATFLLPLAMGVCRSTGGDVVSDAFGVVSMVAMTPLITIQLLGVYYKLKVKIQTLRLRVKVKKDEEIIKIQED